MQRLTAALCITFGALTSDAFASAVAGGDRAHAREERTERKLRRRIASWLGTPYRWGRAERRVGTDCSGFTQIIAGEEMRVDLPRSAGDQYSMGRPVTRDQLRAGDLVFFATRSKNRINHVGVYVGHGVFAHASRSNGVVYGTLASPYYAKRYRGARRVLEPENRRRYSRRSDMGSSIP